MYMYVTLVQFQSTFALTQSARDRIAGWSLTKFVFCADPEVHLFTFAQVFHREITTSYLNKNVLVNHVTFQISGPFLKVICGVFVEWSRRGEGARRGRCLYLFSSASTPREIST